ncbi:MAG: transcription termination factor Rho [Planctomycetes bacterium]|nr:transcription termination factor Rho [Planctomycetota bacterium]
MNDRETTPVEKTANPPRKGGRNHSRWNKNKKPVRQPMLPPDHPTYIEEQLYRLSTSELQAIAKAETVRHYWSATRKNLIVEIIKQQLRRGAPVIGKGIIELTPEQHGYLRNQCNHYQAQNSDPFIPVQIMRQYGLYAGLEVTGKLRQPRGGDKHLVMNEILHVEEKEVVKLGERVRFEKLTALFPEDRLYMEIAGEEPKDLTGRIIDLVTPVGKGQRGLIVAPPRVGKTVLMKKMIRAIEHNHKDVEVIVLLIDERPEEVTDLVESVNANIIASTFDEQPDKHIQVAQTALSRAKVLVENGKDVVLFIDSITRLTRAYNAQKGSNSRMMSGGIDSGSLQSVKQFFGSARNIEEGGSLTIFGTTLVDTGSRMDQVIFEEFKGTGNMELYLDREIAAQRIYPAVNIVLSGTRKDEKLMSADEYEIIKKIRAILSRMIPKDAILHLIEKIEKHGTNAEFLMAIKSAIGHNAI